jgi:hypothetical protein
MIRIFLWVMFGISCLGIIVNSISVATKTYPRTIKKGDDALAIVLRLGLIIWIIIMLFK